MKPWKITLISVAAAAAAAALVLGLLFAGRDGGGIIEDNRFLLDTVVSIRLYDSSDEELLNDAFALIAALEADLSRHHAGSGIDAVNRAPTGTATAVSEDVLEVLSLALDYAERTGGAFDPAIGPLVDLWGIGSDDARVPAAGEIDAVLPLLDYRNVAVDRAAGTVALGREGMSLDLGGIAKGWIADEVAALLRDGGAEHLLLNLGGNVMVAGGKPGGAGFRIGMQDPFDDRGAYLGVFTLTDGSVVSSGIYERFLEADGVRYHHILDPSSGFPVENGLAAVTVLSRHSVDGDALSTSLFAMGLDGGLAHVSALEGVEAAFVTREGRVVMTPGAAERFEATAEGVVVEVRAGG